MRLRSLDLLTMALVAYSITASGPLAETQNARLGPDIGVANGHPFQRVGSVSDALDRLKSDMQLFVKGFNDCPAIVVGSIEGAPLRDTLRDTWTAVQTLQVECWAVLQVDPSARVTATGPSDRITPDMIYGIMAHAAKLSAETQEWRQALTTFPGGVITCKDEERCILALPDGKKPPDESLLFEVILAQGDERFILVTQLYRGQAGFVYGIRWRDTEAGGEVLDFFPQLR